MGEREKIVAWLREEAATLLSNDALHFDSKHMRDIDMMGEVLEVYADAIEQGKHLKNDKE